LAEELEDCFLVCEKAVQSLWKLSQSSPIDNWGDVERDDLLRVFSKIIMLLRSILKDPESPFSEEVFKENSYCQ